MPIGSTPSGTTHYAAAEVLRQLQQTLVPIPRPEHDLESLVYTIFDLTREILKRPDVLTIDKTAIGDIIASWEKESERRSRLKTLLQLARECKYKELQVNLLAQDCAPTE
jgi:hypothetical protein